MMADATSADAPEGLAEEFAEEPAVGRELDPVGVLEAVVVFVRVLVAGLRDLSLVVVGVSGVAAERVLEAFDEAGAFSAVPLALAALFVDFFGAFVGSAGFWSAARA
jgi:hypothetical protein